jgi:hypothetical protein
MPFEGATDSRVRLADMIINENTILRMLAMSRGRIKAIPRGPEDAAKASAARTLAEMAGALGKHSAPPPASTAKPIQEMTLEDLQAALAAHP